MTADFTTYVPGDELVFVALGGAGEIGMNLNLYGCRGQWLMVDLGVTFGDDSVPGIDVMMPDPAFIANQRERLAGILLTHAHEDHLGAVPYLWPRLRAPMYATPFAAALVRAKLAEAGLDQDAEVIETPLGSRFTIGPFDLELVTLTHSIPEPNAVALRTPYGTVLHTGDWKLDPDPLVGALADEKRLEQIGDEGVLAIVCDSTNVLREGSSGSEAQVREQLRHMVGETPGRVIVTCFASNVARLDTVATVAADCGREVGLVGRSLWRIVEVARATGYLPEDRRFLADRDITLVPDRHALIICTGCQGEPRSALYRMATDVHPQVSIKPDDTVIFSSRIIPGNERAIGRLQNLLRRKGARVITERDAFVHVSGHPARDELRRMYALVRPRIAVPVHGEWIHLESHASLAEECGVADAIAAENGTLIRLAPGPADLLGEVPVGRLCADGTRVMPRESDVIRARHRLLYNGSAVATLILDPAGRLLSPVQLSLQGVVEDEAAHACREEIEAALRAALAEADTDDDATVRELARRTVRRVLAAATGRKPVTDIHLLRWPGEGKRKARARI